MTVSLEQDKYWTYEDCTLEVYHLRDALYQVKAALNREQTYEALEVDGVEVNLSEIFAGY